jgi:hypothetical protein
VKLSLNACTFCIGANSYTFTNTGAVVISVKNFPESRGMVMGLNKGYIGLSAANVNIEKLDFGSFKGYILRLLVNIAKYRLQKIRLWSFKGYILLHFIINICYLSC